MDKTTTDYKTRYDQLKADRSTWENHWQDVADYVYPRRADFTTTRTAGAKEGVELYDSTAVHSNELLAAGLHGLLTNPASEWFALRVRDDKLNDDEDVKVWLDLTEKSMYAAINSPKAGFTTQMHETYLEYGGFGTGVLFVGETSNMMGVKFSARPLSECIVSENVDGMVDTVYRQFKFTVRQVVEKWGKKCSERVLKLYNAGKVDEQVKMLHVVEPRPVKKKKKPTAKDLPFASVYLEIESDHILQEGGFVEMPYLVPRFYKAASEQYGRSPAMTVLPDIKMLNKMQETVLRAAQKQVDPPLQVPDDGFFGPVKLVPGGINYYRAGSADRIHPLVAGGNIPITLELENELRGRIQSAFFVDQLQFAQGPAMTATEVMQRTEEKMRLMGPILGRLQNELLGPLVERVFGIMVRAGQLPRPPQQAEGAELKIEYVSPVARAQKQLEAQGMQRALEISMPYIEAAPETMDVFKPDKIVTHLWDMFGVTPSLLNDDDEIAMIRLQRQEQQQQMLEMEQAQAGANAMKTMAEAKKEAGTLNA